MSRILQWTNSNRYRRYPLVDDASYDVYRVDEGGNISNFVFNNEVLLDMSFVTYLHAAPVVTMPYLNIINNPPAPASCTLTFSVMSGTVESLVWVTIPVNSVFPVLVSAVVPGQYRLQCIVGEGLMNICQWSTHRYYFRNPPVILPSCIVAMDKHRVDAVRGSTEASIRLVGNVFVEEGNNVSLTITPETNTLTIAALVGAGKGVSCDVLPNARVAADGIISVNDVLPDSVGNINILDGSGVTIIPFDAHTLSVKATIDDNRIVCDNQ